MNTIQKEVTFRYKTTKDKETGAEFKRPDEVLKISFPVVDADFIAELSEKGASLLQDAVESVIVGRARELLEGQNVTSANFDYSSLVWETIANLPPAQRRGGGIAKELWESFIEDYKAVMPGVTGKSVEQVNNAANILSKRLATVKTSKDHLDFFETQLGLYVHNSEHAGEFTDVLEFLLSKIEEYRGLSAEETLKNL